MTYEVLLVTAEKKSLEVVFDPSGRVLKEEAKDEGEESGEEKVAIDQLPKPVLDAVKKKFPGADLVDAEKETEDGESIYEVALKFKGSTYDVSAKADGTIIEIEKLIATKDLPAAVSKALDQKYPKATFKKTEEIDKDDKVTYEVLLVTADKKTIEVILDAGGKVLKEESKDEGEEYNESSEVSRCSTDSQSARRRVVAVFSRSERMTLGLILAERVNFQSQI